MGKIFLKHLKAMVDYRQTFETQNRSAHNLQWTLRGDTMGRDGDTFNNLSKPCSV